MLRQIESLGTLRIQQSGLYLLQSTVTLISFGVLSKKIYLPQGLTLRLQHMHHGDQILVLSLQMHFHLILALIIFMLSPPFSLIARCLQKIEEDLSSGVLLRSLMDHPRILPNSINLLIQPHSQASHPLGKKLKLLACHVSGRASSREAFQTQLPQLSCSHGQTTPTSSINRILQNGSSFVVDGKVIHMTPLSELC